MRCPALDALPPPPKGKSGWPWTVDSSSLPPFRGDGSRWPRISIVTPSYNQGEFIEETIRSILLQGYPDLEYVVVDGGSTDSTVGIISKYAKWLTWWVSEKDDGQADAINKGLARATGEIFQFINSDDYLAPHALRTVAQALPGHDLVAGVVANVDASGAVSLLPNRNLKAVNFITKPSACLYHQPGVWLRTCHVKALGGFNLRYRCVFDWELQIRYLERWRQVAYVDAVLVHFRLHNASKTVSQYPKFLEEEQLVRDVLVNNCTDADLRAAIVKAIKARDWRLRVDQLLKLEGMSRGEAVSRLCAGVFQDPMRRLNRYSFGALRRIVFRRRLAAPAVDARPL